MAANPVDSLSQIILWASPFLFGGCIWFILRFIEKHDEFHKDVNERFKKIADEQGEIEKKVASSADRITSASLALKKENLDFHGKVNDHLLQLRTTAAKFETKVSGALERMDEMDDRIQHVEEEVEEQQKTISKVVEIAKNVFRVSEEKVPTKKKPE